MYYVALELRLKQAQSLVLSFPNLDFESEFSLFRIQKTLLYQFLILKLVIITHTTLH